MSYYRRRQSRRKDYARVSLVDGALMFKSSYNAGLIAAMKDQYSGIPSSHKRWDPDNKVWHIDPVYADWLHDNVLDYMDIDMEMPVLEAAQPYTDIFIVDYVGAAKDRGDGEYTSLGMVDNDWELVIPESVMRDWFGLNPARDSHRPGTAGTLYAVLGVKASADARAIKKAYRRAAKSTHPDHNKEPDAATQFRRVQEAYEALSDSTKRDKYDKLLLMIGPEKQPKWDANGTDSKFGWRPPVRCGVIQAEVVKQGGRLKVLGISAWNDIYDEHGRMLVASWRFGDQGPTHVWV